MLFFTQLLNILIATCQIHRQIRDPLVEFINDAQEGLILGGNRILLYRCVHLLRNFRVRHGGIQANPLLQRCGQLLGGSRTGLRSVELRAQFLVFAG